MFFFSVFAVDGHRFEDRLRNVIQLILAILGTTVKGDSGPDVHHCTLQKPAIMCILHSLLVIIEWIKKSSRILELY